MQRCVAPRRSALNLFFLPPPWNCTPGPSCTFARSDSAWLCAVRTKARVGPGTVCLPVLCSGKPLRRAGNSSFQRNATLTNGGKTALTSALLRAAKRASTRRRGPERRLRARVQCPWQCCQPGAPPFTSDPFFGTPFF